MKPSLIVPNGTPIEARIDNTEGHIVCAIEGVQDSEICGVRYVFAVKTYATSQLISSFTNPSPALLAFRDQAERYFKPFVELPMTVKDAMKLAKMCTTIFLSHPTEKMIMDNAAKLGFKFKEAQP